MNLKYVRVEGKVSQFRHIHSESVLRTLKASDGLGTTKLVSSLVGLYANENICGKEKERVFR